MGRLRIPLGLLLLIPAACATSRREAPLPEPRVEMRTETVPGSIYRQDRPSAEPVRPEEFGRVVVTFYALERLPRDALDPVADHAELVIESGDGEVFLPAPRFAREGRCGIGPDAATELSRILADGRAGRTRRLERNVGVFGPGATFRASLQELDPVDEPHLRPPAHEAVFVSVYLTADRTRHLSAFGVRRVVEPEPPLPSAGLDAEAAETALTESEARTLATLRTEVLLISRTAGPEVFVFMLPAPFLDAGGAAVAALVEIETAPPGGSAEDEEHVRQVAEYRDREARRDPGADVELLTAPIDPEHALWTGLESAIAGLTDPERRRSALAYLGRLTGAELAEDAALASSEEVVAALATEAHRRAEEHRDLADTRGGKLTRDAVGLVLERTAYEIAFELLRKRDAPAGMKGIILRHTGEVGRHLAMLQEIVEDAESLKALRTAIVAENVIFLADGSPAVRVRAYDWLTQRGNAPEGYDPLAGRAERRKALDRHLARLAGERVGK